MNFSLTEEQVLFKESMQQVAEGLLCETENTDASQPLSEQQCKTLAELGLWGLRVPEAFDGLALDWQTCSQIGMTLASGSASTAWWIAQHAIGAELVAQLAQSGTQSLMLPKIAEGAGIALVGLPLLETLPIEVQPLETGAHFLGPDLIAPSAAHIHWNIWICGEQEEPVMIVADAESGTKQPVELLGLHALNFQKINLVGSIPVQSIIEVKNKAAIKHAKEQCAFMAAAVACGVSERALNLATQYACQRVAFGKPIAKLQAIQEKLSKMSTALAHAKACVFSAAGQAAASAAASVADAGTASGSAAMIAKIAADEAIELCTWEAIQILGGNGVIAEYHVERLWRDAQVIKQLVSPSEARTQIARAALDWEQ
jgi:alkylation response protein AidB-like acyl-CoA dehydrogenase